MHLGVNSLENIKAIWLYLYIVTCVAENYTYFGEHFKQNVNPRKNLYAFLRRKLQKLRTPSITALVNNRLHSMNVKELNLHQYNDKSSIYCSSERNHHCPLAVLYWQLLSIKPDLFLKSIAYKST